MTEAPDDRSEHERATRMVEVAWAGTLETCRFLDHDRQWRALAVLGFVRRRVLPPLRLLLRDRTRLRELWETPPRSGLRVLPIAECLVTTPVAHGEALSARLQQGVTPLDGWSLVADHDEAMTLRPLLQELTWGTWRVGAALVTPHAAQRVLQRRDQPLSALERPASLGPRPLLTRLGCAPPDWRPIPWSVPDLSFDFHPHRAPGIAAAGSLLLHVSPMELEDEQGVHRIHAELALSEGDPLHGPHFRRGPFCFLLEKGLAGLEQRTRNVAL